MSEVKLSDSTAVVSGLADLMRDLVDGENYVFMHVDIPAALYIVEVAKKADDRQDYFPRGKWATIQSIQANIEHALNACMRELRHEA